MKTTYEVQILLEKLNMHTEFGLVLCLRRACGNRSAVQF